MKKHLFILGAGASASITDGHPMDSIWGLGNADSGLPVGSQLVEDIIDYKYKALCGYIACVSSLILNKVSVHDLYHQLIYYIPDLTFYSKESTDKLNMLINKVNFDKIKEKKEVMDTINRVIQALEFKTLNDQNDTYDSRSWIDPVDVSILISLNLYLNCNKPSIYPGDWRHVISLDKFMEIFTKLKNLFTQIFQNLLNNQLSYKTKYKKFHDGIILVINYIDSINLFFENTHDFCLGEKVGLEKNKDTLESWKLYFKSLYIASAIIEKHKPPSIDYFMHNFELFSDYDNLRNSSSLAVKLPTTIEIEKYVKFIICNILLYKQQVAISSSENENDYNYIRQLVWLLAIEAKKACKSFDEYIRENVAIINFNYDHTFEILFEVYSSTKLSELHHVYGSLCITSSDNNCLTSITEDQLFKTLFNTKNTLQRMEIKINKYPAPTRKKIMNILEQCNNSINWIRFEIWGQKIKEYQEMWNFADNIYFLGFGFDKNNIDNIGVTKGCLRNNQKLFVSKGNARIQQILCELFNCPQFTKIDERVFVSNNVVVSNQPVVPGQLPKILIYN